MSAETWHLHTLFSVQTLESDDAVRNLACHEPGVVACAKLICSLHSCEKYMEIRSSEDPHIHSYIVSISCDLVLRIELYLMRGICE